MSSHACSPRDPAEDVQHQQVTQSTILLLIQEATNLAPPADDGSLNSGASHLENPDGSSLILSGPKDSEFTGSFSIMRESDRSSAWEVMRLINQQCERLLQSGGPVDLDLSDGTETIMLSRPPECPAVSSSSVPSNACFSVAVVYSSESMTDAEELKESDDLTELIKTNMSDVSTTEMCWTENTTVESRDEGCSDQGESVLSTGSDCPLDFTSCLVSEQDAESAWLPLNASENTSSSQTADLNNNLVESSNKDIQTLSWDGHRRTQRKQPRPTRSPDPQDPDVQGVTFTMYPKLEGSKDQSKLIITSNYSEEMRRLRRSRSSRCRSLQTSQRSSCSEEESDSCGLSSQYQTPAPEGTQHTHTRSKICASCCTSKTPLWRDAEDGTPLCNACGIRYKKYRVRCHQCWNIPKKEANTNLKCLKCGDVLKLKSSSW